MSSKNIKVLLIEDSKSKANDIMLFLSKNYNDLIFTTLVENVKGVDFLRPALYKTLVRPDDALEMVSLFLSRNKDVKRLTQELIETKQKLDPKRTSSGLTEYGENKKEDFV